MAGRLRAVVPLPRTDPLAALKPSMSVQELVAPAGIESLLLVLDGSGSMSGGPWDSLREAVECLCARSSPAACRLGLVIFSSAADLYAPFTDDFARVSAKMPETCLLGGTAVREALDLALSMDWPGGRCRIVLLSDGMPTTGDPLPAAQMLAGRGIIIDTVACGDGADLDLLRELARVSGGRCVEVVGVAELARTLVLLETVSRGLLSPPRYSRSPGA